MSDQPASSNNNSNSTKPNNNNRRHHSRSRRGPRPPEGQRPEGQKPEGQQPQGGQPQSGPNQKSDMSAGAQRRRPHRNNQNRPRNPNAGPQQKNNPAQNQGNLGINIERIYEKYLNLLDQHLIARRKYHDLFFRADPGQKHKLERNFYNTLNDIRDFESRLAPEARELFEKRNNGLSTDNTYTTNHEIPTSGDIAPPETEWADPHYLRSQQLAEYKNDNEESVGNLDDYLKYKNLI